VLYHTPARAQGRWSEAHQAFVLTPDQLPFWADSDWDLGAGTPATQGASGVGVGSIGALAGANDSSALIATQLLHWVVYVPPPAQRPLLLLQADGRPSPSNSMWVPSWGGVIVVNPPAGGGDSDSDDAGGRRPGAPRLLDAPTLARVAGTFAAQLHALLGLPTDAAAYLDPAAAPADQPAADTAAAAAPALHLPARASGFARWQVDALLRQRAAADLAAAAETLGSLSNIARQLPNLEMPDLIGQQVRLAMGALGEGAAAVRAGDYAGAGRAAREARGNADAAYLHPAVLAQNNFPDSHKLGIYMPLFLPVSVPLAQGLALELVRLARKRGLLPARRAPAAL
jgi:phosphatidylinositol glycan class S